MNIELIERLIRVAIGVVLLATPLLSNHPMRWLGLIGLAPLLTGLVGWCPIYAWLVRD